MLPVLAAFRTVHKTGEDPTHDSVEESRKQFELASKQYDLARKEFLATHQPKLRVRNVIIAAPKPARSLLYELFDENLPIQGQLYVDNVGDGVATIINSHCIVYANLKQNMLPMGAPYEGEKGNNFLGHPVLRPGGSATGLFMSDDPARKYGLSRGAAKLWVMGWIEYQDDNQITRHIRFCRVWEFAKMRFFPVNDPDYDYEV